MKQAINKTNAEAFGHALDVHEVAKATGAPSELLELCPNRDVMLAFAAIYNGANQGDDAPDNDDGQEKANAEAFAEQLEAIVW